MYTTPHEIKKRLNDIRKEQVHIENTIDKQEGEGVYDDSLYDEIDKLEEEYSTLLEELLQMEPED